MYPNTIHNNNNNNNNNDDDDNNKNMAAKGYVLGFRTKIS